MLRAIGLEPPRHVNVHGYWNVDSQKVSKSLGNMISPLAMREKYGFDAFRYFLLREMVFGLDSDFSEAALVGRINADLANNLGNLVSRTVNMTGRFCDGKVPPPGSPGEQEGLVTAAAASAVAKVDEHLRRNEFHRALEAVFAFTGEVNRYLEERAPWKVAKEKTDGWQEHVEQTLYTSCEALRIAALLLAPFLPETAPQLLERLGQPGALAEARLPDAAAWGGIAVGAAVSKGAPLFPRVELEKEG
jgi:methionyl-tRNA synthetase